jgi:uncharacterized membrane protein YoaK (UPF0700 family)
MNPGPETDESPNAKAPLPQTNDTYSNKWLLILLSVIAGSADACSLLGLGLFNAHVTGNLVILAAHIVVRGIADTTLILSLPVFILMVLLTTWMVAGFESLHVRRLPALLLLQFLLLAGSFVIGAGLGPHFDEDSWSAIITGQLAVAAMGVQAALVQLLLRGAPSTVAMTANITRFFIEASNVMFKSASTDAGEARRKAGQTGLVIVGFTVGAALGAGCFAVTGLKSFGFPATLAFIALIMSLGLKSPDHGILEAAKS